MNEKQPQKTHMLSEVADQQHANPGQRIAKSFNNKIYLRSIQQQNINKTFHCHFNLLMYVYNICKL